MTTQTTTNIERMTIELHKAFRLINEKVFNNELPTPAIVIESKGKRSAYGWFTVDKVWKGEEVEVHEIGLSSEHINRPFIEVATTLWHEMVHFHNSLNGIKDTSRGYTYHNKRFKTQCEAYGMTFLMEQADDKYGWFKPVLTQESVELIQTFDIDESAFHLGRFDFSAQPKAEKKQTSWKWMCGCGTIVRSTKPGLNIICGDCGTRFEEQE